MNNQAFWAIIQQSKIQNEDQPEQIKQALISKSANEIIEFEIELRKQFDLSYTSALWGAAYVIMGGCSDDGFDYFRGWLIAQGQEVFQQTLKNPEYLAAYLTDEALEADEYAPEMEEILSVASDAYTYMKTGSFEFDDDLYFEFSDAIETRGYISRSAVIQLDWEEDDLEERYPLLMERFGENPLT